MAHLLAALFPSAFEDWNHQINDRLFHLRYSLKGREQVYPYIAHVDLSDAAAKALRFSAWDREQFARLLRLLAGSYARSVAFDILFPEESMPQNDQPLVAASAESGIAYYPVILIQDSYRRVFNPPAQDADQQEITKWLWHPRVTKTGRPPRAEAALGNFSELQKVSRGIGHINSDPDRDGVHRRFPLLYSYESGYMPCLALRVACDYLEVDPERIEVAFGSHLLLPKARFPSGLERDIRIPIDTQGRMTINFAGPWTDSFPHYALEKLLAAEQDASLADTLKTELDGFLFVVSDLTIKTNDQGPVPFERIYPLSGLHSSILNNILTASFMYYPGVLQALLTSLALASLLWAMGCVLRPLGFSLLSIATYAAFLALTAALFAFRNRLSDLLPDSLGFLLALIGINILRFFEADRAKITLRLRFERYFAPQLISKILQTPEKLMSAEKKVLTVLFSDIAGFTSWCTTQGPEQVLSTLNEYFDEMTAILFRNEGTIDKFIGDGLMAFFGDPIEQPDHAQRAVRTAIEMQQKVRELRSEWERQGRLPVQIRVGINTGEVVVGDLGSRRIVEYTAIGSNVNLSQRLESKAPVGGILISDAVYRLIQNDFAARFAGKITAKGISEEFGTYEVIVP